MKNDAVIRFRLPQALKDDFLRYCEREDIPYSQFLRASIREGVKASPERRVRRRQSRRLRLSDGTQLQKRSYEPDPK